ncbi:MAG TPA: type IV pilus twitching motility protein PilT, partial [Gemmatimonadaceae bacterium]|nr:type IV pilus twitching motility protein PilT [Gemmatimonadaceae bacterium]
MAQLDRLLAVLLSSRGTSLVLAEGDVAKLEVAGSARPITKHPLTGQQIVALLREIAPEDVGRRLDGSAPVSFPYASEGARFVTRAAMSAGKWSATLAPEAAPAPAIPGADVAAITPLGVTPLGVTPLGVPAQAAPGNAKANGNGVTGAHAALRPNGANGNGAGVVPVTGTNSGVGPRLVLADPSVAAAAPGDEAARQQIDDLLRLMVKEGASDLHLRCGEPPILRTHGEMKRVPGREPLGSDLLEAMLRSIMPERNRREYGELNDTDYAYEIEGLARFRANAMRERKGAGAVFRVIPAKVVTVEELGLSQEVQNLCYLTKGLVLVTGPTGSGKSTTLCAMMDLVNRKRHDHVITIEDPIEFVHPNKSCVITQRQVGVHTSSFKHALRAALREDPDIILVGELRDLETISIAIETAETGHLVFGTLHTTTAPSTIDRLIDQFPPDRQEQIRVMLSESLKGVIAQTLCKKIGGGRVAAREVLLSIPAVSNLIREGKTFQVPSVMQTSRKLGMVTLNDALIDLVDGRQVEPKEAYMKSVDKIGFANMLRTRGLDTSFLGPDEKPAAAAPQRPAPAAGAKR